MGNAASGQSIQTTPHQLAISKSFILIASGGLLQTAGETLALSAPGALPAGTALIIFSSVTPGIVLLWLATRRSVTWYNRAAKRAKQHLLDAHRTQITHLAKGALLMLLLLAALWTLATSSALLIEHPLDPAIYDSDAAAFIHYQAEDVLRGINPYTDFAGFWKAVQQFPNAGATPLRRGQFAQQVLSPDDTTISALLHAYAQNPSHAGPEFDPASLHSYPAGAFLLAVPFIWAGLPSTQLLYALCLVFLFLLLVYWAPAGYRWQTLLLLASLSIPITLTLRSSFEVVCILSVIGAWRCQEKHPWLSAGLLGLGCSVKQLAWLFLPFHLVWVARRSGWRCVALSGSICALVFLAINAPFLLTSPAAWASSLLLPVSEPAFPGGIGLITLAQGGWLPLFPGWVYTSLEIAAYLGLLGWYSVQQSARSAASKGASEMGARALVLASLPLLLAQRSLISYTMFLPVLALAALFQQINSPTNTSNSPFPAIIFQAEG